MSSETLTESYSKRERKRECDSVEQKNSLEVKVSDIQDRDRFFWISHTPWESVMPQSEFYITFLCDSGLVT